MKARYFFAAAFCFALTASSFAAPAASRPFTAGAFARPAEVDPIVKPFSEALAEIRSSDTAGLLRVEPNVVLEGSEFGFVIPIAGSGQGGGGTFFRTEGVVVNRSNRSQLVNFYYFPLGGGASNCLRPAVTRRLDANSWYLYTDLVDEVFDTTGFGAVIVLGMTSGGQVDQSARIDGNARIWTPQPGTANGTVSQNFPSVSLQMPAGEQSVFGLRLDEFYRANFGIFNYDTTARTFDVAVDGFRGENLFSVNVDACTVAQAGIPGGPYGSFVLTIGPRDGRALYFTYGSSVDNKTGDAWSVTGRSF